MAACWHRLSLSTAVQTAAAVCADVSHGPHCTAGCLAVPLQAAQAAAATDDYEAAINRTAQELYAALDSAMEAKS